MRTLIDVRLSHSLSSNEPLVSPHRWKEEKKNLLSALFSSASVHSSCCLLSIHSSGDFVPLCLSKPACDGETGDDSSVCHRVTSSWMTGEGHGLKKEKEKKQRQAGRLLSVPHLPFCFFFFLNTVRLFSGRKRCRFINVKLTVTKILLVKGPL